MDNYQAMNFYYGLLNLRAGFFTPCLLYTSPSPRDAHESRIPS